MVGDAIPVGSGFLVAAATSKHECAQTWDAAPQVVRLFLEQEQSDHTDGFTPVDDVPHGGALVRVRLSPRSDGGWLFTQTFTQASDGVDQMSAIRAFRVSSSAHALDGGTEIVSPGRSGFAVAPRGDGFAIAWIEPGGTALDVALFDPSGAQTTAASFPLAAGASTTDPLSLLVAPDGAALLVAWSQHTTGDVDQVHVTRFDCSG